MLAPEYPLHTARLTLRPFEGGDLDALLAIQSRPEVARYLYWEPRGVDEVRHALAGRAASTALHAEGDRLSLAVVWDELGAVVGEVCLMWLSREHRQGELGYLFHPDHGGRGLATEAAAELLRLGFDDLGLHRIIGRCDPRNAASIGVLRRLGMRREAHFVHHEVVKGEWGDELVYAVREDEWRAALSRRARP